MLTSEIADAIYQQTGKKLDEKEFEVPEIKSVGTYECRVKLHPDVAATFSIVIQKEKQAPGGEKKAAAKK